MALNPWDFNEKLDTTKSYACFSAYLNMGPDRSLERTEAAVYDRPNGPPKVASGFIKKWSSKGNWVQRAKDYDQVQAKKVIAAIRKNDVQRRKDNLEQFRITAESTAKKQVQIEDGLATLARDCMFSAIQSSVGVTRELKQKKDIDMRELGQLVTMMCQVSSLRAHDTWAKSLQIDKMQTQLDNLEAAQQAQKKKTAVDS